MIKVNYRTIDCQKKLDLLKDLLYNYVNVSDDSDIPENVVEAFVKEIRVSKNGFEGDFCVCCKISVVMLYYKRGEAL